MIEYMVAYICGHKMGNAKIMHEQAEMSMDEVRKIEKMLEERYEQKAVVLNIVKLREVE